MEKVEFVVEGMSCDHCVRRVKQAILSTGRTADVEVDLATGRVSFLKDEGLNLEEVIKAIELYGYWVGRA